MSQLVFIPYPIISHLAAAVETAKLLAERDDRLSITVLLMKRPSDTKIEEFIKKSPDSRLNFIEIYESPNEPKRSLKEFALAYMEGLRDQLVKLMKNQEKTALVIDLFCDDVLDLANELGISTFIFSSFGAAVLGLLFHLHNLTDGQEQELKQVLDGRNAELSVPAYINPVPVRVFPSIILEGDKGFLNLPKRLRKTNGMLLNTFCELETHAISAITCDEKNPPVYPIGPMIPLPGEVDGKNRVKRDEIIEWMDGQPDSSVVYICFGSMGCFEKDQVAEIALGLEQSGHRFLWSLRKPPPKGTFEFPGEYENFDEILPEGFLERTSGKGKVIGWAPQMAILSHPVTGGFVSHCGWSSTLESISCGVPMAVWPLAAEQQANAFLLVKELGVAVDIQMDYRAGSDVIVGADKIANAITQLMNPKDEIRAQVKVMKDKSKMAPVEGGSSYHVVGRFLEDIKR